MLSVIKLNVIILDVIKLIVIMLNGITLSVMAPSSHLRVKKRGPVFALLALVLSSEASQLGLYAKLRLHLC
jgi:hypothetical protein